MKKAHYLAGDMKRAFLSGHFILAVAGTVVTLLFIAKTQVRFPQDILYIYDGVTMTRMALLVLVFGTIPYGICFCEDFEHKYIYISVIRGDIKRYVWSKLLAVFISAFAAMALGKLLFFLIMENGMSDLVYARAYRLDLTHPLLNRDSLAGGAEITVHIPADGLEVNRNRRGPAQGLQKRLVMPHVAR